MSTCPTAPNGRRMHYFRWDERCSLWVCADCSASITNAESSTPPNGRDYRYVDAPTY